MHFQNRETADIQAGGDKAFIVMRAFGTYSTYRSVQNDRSDIWGFAACCAAVPDSLLLSALRTELSKHSLVA
jgi:hypothetical protein